MKIYLDEKLKKYCVPKEMRNNSKAENKVFTPGTRIPLPDEVKVIRLFTAWASLRDDIAERTDIDLGGAFIKETPEGLELQEIAYYNQSSNYASHSGDFTSCKAFNPKDGKITAEYIDVDIEKVRGEGFRYIITAEFIYGGKAEIYSDIRAWSGVQLLSNMRTEKKGEININDSLFKVKLDGSFRSHTAIAIDVITKEIVILDQYSEERSGINIHSMANKMNEYKKLYFNATDFNCSVYGLLEMYAEANDFEIVQNPEDANILCSYNDFKDLSANQVNFNVSDNLENIINLLN